MRPEGYKPFPIEFLNTLPHDFPGMTMLRHYGRGVFLLMHRAIYDKYDVRPKGIIHLGGHIGEELLVYLGLGFEKVLVVEPQPQVFAQLERNARVANGIAREMHEFIGEPPRDWVRAVSCAVGREDGTTPLYCLPRSPQSSILRPMPELLAQNAKEADAAVREIPVMTRTLDTLLREVCGAAPEFAQRNDFNVLWMNIQGAELLALQGALETLSSLEIVLLEVNFVARYVDSPATEELDAFLESRGFAPIFGVGADEFGFRGYRRIAAATAPDESNVR
jgi:FkbM family methyltransferase